MGAMGGSSSGEIDAPLQAVWAIVADVESWPQWQRMLSTVAVEERDADGRPSLCEVVFDAGVQTIRTTQSVRYEPPHALSFAQRRGNLKRLRGGWRLQDAGEGRTRATYELEIEPGGLLGRLVSGSVEERLREVLVTRLPGELRARAES